MNYFSPNIMMQEISLQEFPSVRIGHAQNFDAMTGVSVLLFDGKAIAGVDISGGGPASRETPLLNPLMACENIHAIVLSGGSAFGLEASIGVTNYLEEHHIGFDTGYALVPLVCQSSIYDLSLGRSDIRPDKIMGYHACQNAFAGNDLCGIIGAGTGASVGKLTSMKRSMKSGLGIYACQVGSLKVAAIVVVNALGDIFQYDTGKKIAGMLNEERTAFSDIETALYTGAIAGFASSNQPAYTTNTTIGVILTNAAFSKAEMNKIASMCRSAYSRCINPVGTTADGDTIYAVSTGNEPADINTIGVLAARAMGCAIEKAIQESAMTDEEYLKKCLDL